MKLTDKQISALEELGFKRWKKSNHDRLYAKAELLGLECEFYKTGNIQYATFCGKKISNTRARCMRYGGSYIDVNSGRIYAVDADLERRIEEILENVLEKKCGESDVQTI